MVRERRLELLRRKAYAPKAYVYTNFTTRAVDLLYHEEEDSSSDFFLSKPSSR